MEEEFNSEPRIYGGVEVSQKEGGVLELPPKYGIFGRVTKVDTLISMEEAINKLRWKKAYEKERENRTEATFIHPRNDQMIVDINCLRLSTLPYNNKARMAPPMKQEEEVKVQYFKNEVIKVAEEFEKKKDLQMSNLEKNMREGLKSLKERVREGEVVCYVTDKSGRWSCDSMDNYKRACEEQLRDEKIEEVSQEQHEKNEKEINAHALAFGRMLGLKDGEEGKPLRNVMTAEGSKLAKFYGLRKDHKDVEQGSEKEGPKDSNTQCNSTEELLAEKEEVNREEVREKWVVGSMDITSLYPSLDIKRCAKVVRNELYASKLIFRNLQWKEISLYLVYNMARNELNEYGLEEHCPKRRRDRRPPTFEASGSCRDRKKRHDPWIFPRNKPHNDIVRKMFCMAIEVMVVRTMALHEFQFDGKMYRQKSGGAIGLDLTGVVADIYI